MAIVGAMLAVAVIGRAYARGYFVGPIWSRPRATGTESDAGPDYPV
jgi:hypothetical protein